jgi:hypothetical protein
LVAGLLLIAGCSGSGSNRIVGKWTTASAGVSQTGTTEFLADGTVTVGSSSAKYTLAGDKLTIEASSQTLVYRITWDNADKFRLADEQSPGQELEFNRVK